jgi:hypothetical protein
MKTPKPHRLNNPPPPSLAEPGKLKIKNGKAAAAHIYGKHLPSHLAFE